MKQLFTPLSDFYNDELKSGYTKGLTYRVTTQNSGLVGKWLVQRLVKFIDQPATATLTGKGSV